ncbi:MAG: hypothetical protein RLZZ117_847 [Cyanobacteriota bacterium]
MSQRTFAFRLRSSHPAPDHATESLVVEVLADTGEWQPQVPSLLTPGFRLYLLSLLLCQHHYLVANALERGIPLRQVEGAFSVITSSDWILENVTGDFRLRLDASASGEERARADAEAIAQIAERMKLCPVSRNLPPSVKKRTDLSLVE